MRTRYSSRILIVTFLMGAYVQVASAQLLQKGFESIYEVHHNNIYLGDTVRKLTKLENGQWEYGSYTEAKGFVKMFVKDRIEERSKLEINLNQVKPFNYTYNQSGGKREQKFNLTYNWDKNILTNTYLDKELELVPGTQDLLSFVLQIMLELQHNKEIIEMHIADKRRLDSYQLKVIGKESVETPFKTLPTVVLLSNKIKGKRQFKLWCAPSLQYLPIRIQKIEDDGDEDTMALKELKLPGVQAN